MMYELWHVASGNMLEDFETEPEALAAVRAYVAANDAGMLWELSLSAVPTGPGDVHAVLPPTLAGEALAERVGVKVHGDQVGTAMRVGGTDLAAGIPGAHGATSVREYRDGKRIG